ncbi:hypothetical protein RB594_002834 [Gaeumannomyces avenae]
MPPLLSHRLFHRRLAASVGLKTAIVRANAAPAPAPALKLPPANTTTRRGLANKAGALGEVAPQAQKTRLRAPAPPAQTAAPPPPANMSPGCGGSCPHLASGKTCPNPSLPPSSSCNIVFGLRNNNRCETPATIFTQRTEQIAGHLAPAAVMSSPSPYTVRKVGAPNTLEHRVYVEKEGVPLSPFHDIPLFANQEQTVLNMVVEIPRWTNAKLEISKDELLNPIKQDIKKGKLRYVRNCFPHKGYLWNYGAFPQTWEDPNAIHPETKAKGDNDPLDVCEIGELVGYTGQVKQVKVLGVMALLDEEETDWKVIVIDVNDPLASKLNDVEDVERHLPGLLRATNEWFRIYKIPDGKPENQFAFTGECKNKKYAMDVIRECSEAWERLITGKTQPGNISTTNLAISHSPSVIPADRLPPMPANQNLPPEKIDASIDKWFFISGASA